MAIASTGQRTAGATFALYSDQQGGAPLWIETQNIEIDAAGHYSVLLGATKKDGVPAELFASGEARWLGVKIADAPEAGRVLLVSVPYALKAGDAETLGGLPASAFLLNPIAAADASSTTAASESRNYINAKGVNNSVSNAVSASLTGTGTTGKIVKWLDGTGTLGDSSLYDTGTKIGLGTVSPIGYIDVFTDNQAGYLTLTPFNINVYDKGFLVRASRGPKGSPSAVQQGDNLFNLYAQGYFGSGYGIAGGVAMNVDGPPNGNIVPGRIEFRTSSSSSLYLERMRIDSQGRVAIGTSQPTSLLTVFGTIESKSGGFKFPDGSVLPSAINVPSVTTSVNYTGSTPDQIFRAMQNQPGNPENQGFNASGVPSGLRGDSTTTSGYAAGVFGSASSPLAPGVAGVNLSSCPNQGKCNAYGVFGWSVVATNGAGVWGQADATTGASNVGVYGESKGDAGTGVQGFANNAASGDGTGVYGLTNAPNGAGVWGNATAAQGNTIGVYGSVIATAGVAGQFDSPTNGTILLGRSGGNSFTKVFRVDSTGKGFFNGGTQTGGADFAESVDVLGGASLYEPGDVMMIDNTGERRLALATGAYSTKVAGIYSTKPGVLATPHTMDDPRLANEVPLAIVGIVPCKVSAENGPIHAGDLLVTSTRPGYAMKGTDRRKMMGAVVGKALGSLDKGTGTIEVLVSLH